MAEGNSIPVKLQRMLIDSDFESALEFLTGTSHASSLVLSLCTSLSHARCNYY